MNRWPTALRLSALIALVFCSASGVQDYLGDHSFCAPGGGCDAVRESAIGLAIGKVLPALGILTYATIPLATMARSPRLQRLALVLAIAGGLGGTVLLATQALAIGQFCWLCVGVDTAALATAVFAALSWRTAAELAPKQPWIWQVATLWALAVPPIWTLSRPAEVPALVEAARLDQHVNIMEWSDFSCPHCREMHPVMEEIIRDSKQPVNLVRINVPLQAMHNARAYRCAIEQGQGEAMANALFTATKQTQAACAELATELGLDPNRYHSCVNDPATDAAIEADKRAVRDAGFDGLPTVWIGGRKFVGFDETKSPAWYAEALENADTRPRHRLGGWLALAMLSLLLGALRTRP